MKLRVAFAGASGTGKTTLAKKVLERTNEQRSSMSKKLTLLATLRNRTRHHPAWEAAHEEFVVDASSLDYLAAVILWHGGNVPSEIWDTAATATSRYTHVIYCPTASFVSMQHNPTEPLASRLAFDALIRGLLAVTHTPHLVLNQTLLESRQEAVARFLGAQNEVSTLTAATP